jgi:hypothetical protein
MSVERDVKRRREEKKGRREEKKRRRRGPVQLSLSLSLCKKRALDKKRDSVVGALIRSQREEEERRDRGGVEGNAIDPSVSGATEMVSHHFPSIEEVKKKTLNHGPDSRAPLVPPSRRGGVAQEEALCCLHAELGPGERLYFLQILGRLGRRR